MKKYKKWNDIRRSKASQRENIRRQALEDVIEMNLKEVRNFLGKTQKTGSGSRWNKPSSSVEI